MRYAWLIVLVALPVFADEPPPTRLEASTFGGMTTTTGEVDGERFRSETTEFGGIVTTTGRVGERSFRCETVEFGGVETTTCR